MRKATLGILAFLISITISVQEVASQEVVPVQRNTIYIFLLDTSLSMKEKREKEALPFNRVREFLLNKVRESIEGDRILIITFDETVTSVTKEGVEIISRKDKKRLESKIRTLKPKGQWTWMSEGLRVLSQNIGDLRERYREKRIETYFLTDGKNDPPPEREEPLLRFVELVQSEFRDFRTEDTYIYLLYSNPGAVAPEERERTERTTGVVIKRIPEEEEEPVLKQVKIGPEELILGYVKRGTREIEGGLIVESLTTIENIPLELRIVSSPIVPTGMNPLPENTRIQPSVFSIRREGQKLDFSFRWDEPLRSLGKYYGELAFGTLEDVVIIPEKVKVSFSLLRDTGRRLWLGDTDVTLPKITESELDMGKVERSFSLRIRRVQNLENTRLELQPLNADIEIEPSTIPSKKGTYDIMVAFPPEIEPGLRTFEIGVSHQLPDVEIYPTRRKIILTVKVEKVECLECDDGILPKILRVLLLLATVPLLVLSSYLGLVRKREVWIRREDSEKILSTRVSGWRKSYLSDIDIPNYYLQFDWFKNRLYLKKVDGTLQQVQHNKEITCTLPDSTMTNIITRLEPFQQK